MARGGKGDKSYTTNILMSALGISRETLRYYEQMGIVRPRRMEGSNYRRYSNADMFAAVETIVLKNAGFQLAQAGSLIRDQGLEAAEFTARGLHHEELRLLWAQAVARRLRELDQLVNADFDSSPRLVVPQTWLVHYDGAENGYDHFAASTTQDALLDGMPVSTFAAIIDVDMDRPGLLDTRWGRAVPEQYEGLLLNNEEIADGGQSQVSVDTARDGSPTDDEEDSLDDGGFGVNGEAPFPHSPTQRVGGRPCLQLPYRADWDEIPGFDPDGSVCASFAKGLRELGLRADGPVIAPDVLPVCGMVHSNLYLPVRAASIRGKVVLAALNARRALFTHRS